MRDEAPAEEVVPHLLRGQGSASSRTERAASRRLRAEQARATSIACRTRRSMEKAARVDLRADIDGDLDVAQLHGGCHPMDCVRSQVSRGDSVDAVRKILGTVT